MLKNQHQTTRLLNWLNDLFPLKCIRITPLCPDASSRRYFRANMPDTSVIVADCSQQINVVNKMINMTTNYLALGLPVPMIHHHDVGLGYVCLDDLGTHRLIDRINPHHASHFYDQALGLLTSIRHLNQQATGYAFGPSLYWREFNQFEQFYLNKWAKLDQDDIRKAWRSCYEQLIDAAEQQPQVGIHRDYHSQNIMIDAHDQLSIIDFQDSAIGPISYDVISLLKDCYISWPKAQIEQWLQQHYYHHIRHHWPIGIKQWQHHTDFMGLQRHIKALGTFAQKIDTGDWRYYDALLRTEGHIKNTLIDYPEFHMITTWLQQLNKR